MDDLGNVMLQPGKGVCALYSNQALFAVVTQLHHIMCCCFEGLGMSSQTA